MNTIQFERRKRKKILLLPLLLVLLLLYITIPAILISKGSKQLNKAKNEIEKAEIYAPSVEFYNGMSFLQTAASFPGFSLCTDNILTKTTEKLLSFKDDKLKTLILNSLQKKYIDLKNINISKKPENNQYYVQIISQDSVNAEIEINDSLLNKIDSIYCKPWNKFFEKTSSDKSKLHTICNQ